MGERSTEGQIEGLERLVEAASRLHGVNLVVQTYEPGDLPEVRCHVRGVDVSVVCPPDRTEGYDVWHFNPHPSCCPARSLIYPRDVVVGCVGHPIEMDVSLERAVQAVAKA